MASPTSTRPGTDRRPLLAYLRVQRDREREMIAILQRASARINRELAYLANRPGIGAAVRREQLLMTKVAIHDEISAMWESLGRTVLAGRADAAAAAARLAMDRTLLSSVFPAGDVDYLIRSAEAQARQGIDTVEARAKLSKIPLAESVYKNRELTNGKIDAIVDNALARGASARDLAKDVRRFIRPDVRGGVKYAALRLGRTELNNAFHAQQVVSGVETPWVTGMRWNLSGSHPKPDECNEYADEKHEEDMPAGVFSPENVPGKPHPNCLCFMTSETVDREEFVRRYMAGDFDTFTDSLMRNGSITFR